MAREVKDLMANLRASLQEAKARREAIMAAAVERCGARTVFWPDDEACDAECHLPAGHEPAERHEDATLGEWREGELNTWRTDGR